ncbi:MAG: methionine adenosyltransferase, partial [Candidatus Omnitrophica bacterium]|nr:methionine adenosyltransferase [Candidatus Omnitrophota bacterium]
KLSRRLSEARKKGLLKYLGPDGKSQVTVEYHDGQPKRVDCCVLASQHTEEILDSTKEKITKAARQELIDIIAKPVLKDYMDKDTKFFINETGKFVIGGPQSDTGMTGRKIVVDTYGGMVASGGGAFSGKDPTKVDRSAAYMARYVAKNIVAAGLAEKCLIHLAYVIGRAEPLAVMVDTYETGKLSEAEFVKLIRDNFDLTPTGMIKQLDLLRPIYRKTAAYGHFGRTEPEFVWESTDKAQVLKKAAGKKI